MAEERELDKLKDSANYEVLCDMSFFIEEGTILTGKQIKDNCPFDVSPNQGITTFFKEV